MTVQRIVSDGGGEARRLRSAAIGALVVSLIVGLASSVLFLAAFQFRTDWFLEPASVVGAGATSAELLRWASVLDLIGYYLATAVLAYVLWRLLRPRAPVIADLSTLAALGYALAGGTAAAVLAMVGPMLMHEHAAAGGPDRAAIARDFTLLLEVVWRGIWQLLDAVLLAAWWLGIGLLLRADQPILSRLSLVLAALAVVGGAVNVLGIGVVRDVALGVLFALWTVWWALLLVLAVRRRGPFSGRIEPAAVGVARQRD